jgi:hypothetical protein
VKQDESDAAAACSKSKIDEALSREREADLRIKYDRSGIGEEEGDGLTVRECFELNVGWLSHLRVEGNVRKVNALV